MMLQNDIDAVGSEDLSLLDDALETSRESSMA